MLISVVVPVYNVEKYLRVCLDSIINQTYGELEVILVDDGSTDSSGKICNEYVDSYPNFKVIHKQNDGLGMARNTGLEYVTGDYVTFVDSDDYLNPDCIEKLYSNLVQCGVDVCKGGFRRVSDLGEEVSRRQYVREIFENEDVNKRLLPRMIGSSPSQHDSIEMCVCGAVYKIGIIKEYCLKFLSERELISEDIVFNIDYLQHANGVCIVSEIGYNYRLTEGSLTSCYRADRFEASKYFYYFMKKKLESLGYEYDTLLRLQRIFFIYVRMCLIQESGRISGHSKKESISNIEKICKDQLVQDMIGKYPKKQMGLKQNIFLAIIKNKFKNLLYLLIEMEKI